MRVDGPFCVSTLKKFFIWLHRGIIINKLLGLKDGLPRWTNDQLYQRPYQCLQTASLCAIIPPTLLSFSFPHGAVSRLDAPRESRL